MSAFLTVEETAKRYGVSVPTIYRWIKVVPDFPKPRMIGPNSSRFYLSEIEEYERGRPFSAAVQLELSA